MFLKLIALVKVITLCVFTYGYDEDAFVETVFENEADLYPDISSEESRQGRQYTFKDNSMVDLLINTMAPQYAGRKLNDIFDFLRDSYQLPGGLTAPYDEYDYVIVGAGSAGSVLAARLTENKNVTVLLLEVGKPEMLLTDVPGLSAYFQATDYTWQYYMEPQPDVCTGMINGRCFWPRGKAVGGTSVINYMIYTRGRPLDWDRIANAGNYGWSYKDVLKYYMKSEKLVKCESDSRTKGSVPLSMQHKATLLVSSKKRIEKLPHRSRDGELPVEFVPKRSKLVDAFLAAGRTLGNPTTDYNSPYELGFGYVQTTTSFGRRFSAAKSFLHKRKKRQNLHILPESTATKVLIDRRTMTAFAVNYVRNNIKYTVRARREIILSAGPIASPQLLMLSGIGPKENLESVGIPVLKDMPVGQTLYDHICFPGLIFELNTTGISFNEAAGMTVQSILTYIRNGNSIVASPGGVEGIGYIKTAVSDDPDPVPDIELIDVGGSLTSDGGSSGSKATRRGMKILDSVFDSAFGEVDRLRKDTWSSFPMLLHPISFGRIELKSSNPFSHPRMYGNYLTHPKDVATFIASIRYIQALAATPAFQRFGAKIIKADFPMCRSTVFDSDEYWECALRALTATLHHQIATCRMGPVGDPLAIVDPELRVHGVRRLRVVDSSVIPRTVSAHTNAPAIMIGEKAADMIKMAWN